MIKHGKCQCGEMDRIECQCEYWEKDEVPSIVELLDIPPWEEIPPWEDIDWGDEETNPGWEYESEDEDGDESLPATEKL